MFKNRSMQVKLIKDTEPGCFSSDGGIKNPLILDLNMLLTDNLDNIVKGVVTVMVARKVLNTACEMVLIRAARG